MAIDISRSTQGIVLPKEQSDTIWQNAINGSAVMRHAKRVHLPGSGVTIPVIVGDPVADWVGETDEIKVSRGTFSSKDMTGYKIGVIIPVSKEFRRDIPALYKEVVKRAPAAIAKKFDSTVFGSSAPGSNFDTLGGSTAVAIKPHASDAKKNTYIGLVEAFTKVAEGGGSLDGWALSPQAKALLLQQLDGNNRPLLLDSIQNGSPIAQLLGESVEYTSGVYAAGTPSTLGFAGDWSNAAWGNVEGIKIDISDQASITDGVTVLEAGDEEVSIPNVINLWQRDMFAVKVTAELGFRVRSASQFVKLTDAARS